MRILWLLPVAAIQASAATPPTVDFVRDVQPILAHHCYECHGPVTKKADLRWDRRDSVLNHKDRPIIPGQPDKSPLIDSVTEANDTRPMPPEGKGTPLSAQQVATLKAWVQQGANWPDSAAIGPDPRLDHWAFKKSVKPAIPTVHDKSWTRNEIDSFIAARHQALKLAHAPEADRYTLARRVSLDLIGLPPTVEQADAFARDTSPDAYEKYVERLLASPAFGERWASKWIDLARYADSNGYANDNPRTIWRWRDWVIDAINANMPFDRFVVEQIAGDLLPNPTSQQILATAFHRNTLSNDEGGTDDEEFRVAAVIDRVNTTMSAFMGLTFACAQCHDHKYDPFTMNEYYRLFAIFNNTEDADKNDNSPLLEEPTPEQQKKIDALKAQIAELEKKTDKTSKDQLAAKKKELAGIKPLSTPIMRELTGNKRRTTHILLRGNFLEKGDKVTEGFPALFQPATNNQQPATRLDLANWLVSRDNPLTARVTVNRFWEELFGTGIVETSEDFGVRSKPPTHPELLDYLAVRFQEEGWDVKKFLKLLVTSATYRQSSRVAPEAESKDPTNIYLARGPRVRSTAETIRDQSLFSAGLLSPKLHGPPVRPPRPKLGLNAAFAGSTDWTDSTGEDRYRRGLYTLWRRTSPYPSMITFDAATRNVCQLRRPRTNTPLQALTSLNDPAAVECAQALGRRALREGGETLDSRLTLAFRLVLTRPPSQSELSRLGQLYHDMHLRYNADPKAAQQIATTPLGPLPAGVNLTDAAAMTIIGNVLLNLDETLSKR